MKHASLIKSHLGSAADLFLGVFLIGLVFSKYLLSISMFGLGACALAYCMVYQKCTWHPIKSLMPFAAITLIFWATLLSGLHSSDTYAWMIFVKQKLPFLVLPISFWILRDHISRRYYHMCAVFFTIVLVSTVFVLINYILHFESINEMISKGQSFPTPVDHIKYSLFMAFSICIGLILYVQKFTFHNVAEKHLYMWGSVFLIVALHAIAVRSGLAVFYLTVFVLGLKYFLNARNYKALWGFLLALIILPFIAYRALPSLQKKVGYTLYDIDQYLKGKGKFYSDSERIYSYQVGLTLIRQHPFFGTGIGDLKAECLKTYKETMGGDFYKYPHNQYLFIWAGMGIVGLILFLIAVLFPFMSTMHRFEPIFWSLNLIILISFLVENTLERSYSAGFYLYFLLAGLCYLTEQWKSQK